MIIYNFYLSVIRDLRVIKPLIEQTHKCNLKLSRAHLNIYFNNHQISLTHFSLICNIIYYIYIFEFSIDKVQRDLIIMQLEDASALQQDSALYDILP